MGINLNENQLKVVNELNKNIFLIAPAGTGKTNTLAKRISNIIESKKCSGEEILCITFTNKACNEMKERILKELSKDSSLIKEGNKITIKTFHSFCLQVIKEEAKKKTDIFTDFTVFDDIDSLNILEKFEENFCMPIKLVKEFIDLVKRKRYELGFLTENELDDYRNTINLLKDNIEDIIFKYNSNRDLDLNKIKNNLIKKGVQYVRIYNRELINNHALDFNDLVFNFKKLFSDENIVDKYKNRYKYINIDEVQDTSLTDYEILKKIFYGNNVLLSGDRFQTIYSWRGSNPKEIEEDFKKNFNPLIIKLHKNYRSTKILTDSSVEYLKKVSLNEFENIYEKVYANSKENGEEIIVKQCKDIEDEANYIMKSIKDIIDSEGKLDSTCILTRNNFYGIDLSKALNKLSKPSEFEFILVDEYKFFKRVEIKDILAFFKLIINHSDSNSLERILLNFNNGIGKETLWKIIKDYREFGVKLTDFIDEKSEDGDYFSVLLEELEKDNVVVFDVESTGRDVTEDRIIQVAGIKINKKGEVLEKFERFIKPDKKVGSSEAVHGFSDEFLHLNGEDKETVLKDFLDFSNGTVIVGHNVNYDINILNSELSRAGMEKPKFLDFYDTLDIYRRFYPNEINHKLEYLSDKFKTNHKPSHDAMDDIIATGELLINAVENKIKPNKAKRFECMNKYYKKFKDIKEELNNLFYFSENNTPKDILLKIVEDFDLNNKYKKDTEKKRENIAKFGRLINGMYDGSKSYKDSIIELVNLTSLSNGEIEEVFKEKTGINRIPIITVHQAKGLEYNNVFIAGMYQNGFPSYISVKKNELDEEIRVFYVAMTRAKKRLILTYPEIVVLRNGPKKVWKSQFIDNIPATYKKYL